MIGDVLLIEERHHKAAEEVFKRVKDRDLNKLIIAIGGESGSGKSEIAHLLRRKFKDIGVLSKIFHIDNYYKTSPAERTEWRKKHGVENVGFNEYNWDQINKNIGDFKAGREAVMPFVDIVTDQVDQLTTNFSEIQVLILEGLYAIKADADFKVLIGLTYHDTKKAQVVRGKEPQNKFRAEILEREHQVVQGLANSADLVITKEMMGM